MCMGPVCMAGEGTMGAAPAGVEAVVAPAGLAVGLWYVVVPVPSPSGAVAGCRPISRMASRFKMASRIKPAQVVRTGERLGTLIIHG